MADFISEFKENIFNITQKNFEIESLRLFHYQRKHCKVYHDFIANLSKDYSTIKSINEIPFLPIELFKSHKIITSKKEPKILFESSGTTGSITSKHYVPDLSFYKKVSLAAFESFFGSIQDYTILALLPSYLERKNSSLVYMVKHFIESSKKEDAGFYLNEWDELIKTLKLLSEKKEKVLLIGVSYALLDLCEKLDVKLGDHVIVMETGGMKGKRKELIREELHALLRSGLGVEHVYSEYGMTELLSQSYLTNDGFFHPPLWKKFLVSSTEDPFELEDIGRGVLNVIDLANVDSCAFIQLQDAGKIYLDGSFEVLGRVDNTDVRGCNLMYL